jgi:hypothetical protein
MPISLVIESPIIMLLAASTALSQDWASYCLGRRFMLGLGGFLSALHALVAFTPLYDLLAGRLLGVPEDVFEPARLGLRIMTPWTFSIAYRRFQQGVLIRFGHSRAVGFGTAVRLAAIAIGLAIGSRFPGLPGIAVGTLAVIAGVVCEALFIAAAARPVVRGVLRTSAPVAPPLTSGAFLRFYVPLMLTPLFLFLVYPLTSAAITRMARTVDSLAVWPVLHGLVLTVRSAGIGLNEVVVAMLDRPRALASLRRFSLLIAAGTSGILLLIAATPLAGFWFERVSALPPSLAALGHAGLWLALLLPGMTALQSYYQGAIVHSRRTRGVTESVAIMLAATTAALAAGVALERVPGILAAITAMTLGSAVQLAWLWHRARRSLRDIESRDAPAAEPAWRGTG